MEINYAPSPFKKQKMDKLKLGAQIINVMFVFAILTIMLVSIIMLYRSDTLKRAEVALNDATVLINKTLPEQLEYFHKIISKQLIVVERLEENAEYDLKLLNDTLGFLNKIFFWSGSYIIGNKLPNKTVGVIDKLFNEWNITKMMGDLDKIANNAHK